MLCLSSFLLVQQALSHSEMSSTLTCICWIGFLLCLYFFCPMMCHLNTPSCTNGNLLYVFIGGGTAGQRSAQRHLCPQFSYGYHWKNLWRLQIWLLRGFQKTTCVISFWGNTVSYQQVFSVPSATRLVKLSLTSMFGIVTTRIKHGWVPAEWICRTSNFFVTAPVVTRVRH